MFWQMFLIVSSTASQITCYHPLLEATSDLGTSGQGKKNLINTVHYFFSIVTHFRAYNHYKINLDRMMSDLVDVKEQLLPPI